MHTIDRISRLLSFTGKDWDGMLSGPPYGPSSLHEVLDVIDTIMNIDTAYASSCSCAMHMNGACSARRYVGARLALLEECMAREEITSEIRDLQEQYQYG